MLTLMLTGLRPWVICIMMRRPSWATSRRSYRKWGGVGGAGRQCGKKVSAACQVKRLVRGVSWTSLELSKEDGVPLLG